MNFRNKSKRERQSEINLTPLIDIVFNLLIFFLITSTSVQNPGIEVELPKSSDAPTQAQADNIILAITADGRIVQDGVAVSPEELVQKLTERHKKGQNQTVIIQADTTTAHGKVVEVMDIAR
ncbi:biopolymer transporter ExbD, partial [Myxococcota bacterium]|nr:biopolymer transporter ExbD [Myxococcota bacterium]